MTAPIGSFVERVMTRVKASRVDLAELPDGAASASLYGGAAGVAFFLLEAARLRGDDDLLALARRWRDAARERATRDEAHAFHDVRAGFVHGEAGLSYVDARLALRDGDRAGVLAATRRIARAAEALPRTPRIPPTELLGGAAGVARAARSLEAMLPTDAGWDPHRAALSRAHGAALDLLLARYRSTLDPPPDAPLGFAHGTAGELWGLVASLGADHAVVAARLGELAALREVDDEGLVYWLSNRAGAGTSMLGTVCNGMPGHTLLWCEVARQTRDDAALDLARRCAESTAILTNGLPTFCCGLAGQSTALRAYADVSGDARFARRADARLARAVRLADRAEGVPLLGLWRGVLGVALVAMGRLHEERTLPGLEAAQRVRKGR